MIVDTHTHIWDSPDQLGQSAAKQMRDRRPNPWDAPTAGTLAHNRAMQAVDKAFIHSFESEHLGADIPVEQVLEYIGKHPGRYLGFAGIDPMRDGHLRRAEAALELGMVGITISPGAQAFHPSHTRAMAVYEMCQDRGVPILVHGTTHMGTGAQLQYAAPYLLDEVAHQFPELRMVVSQVGYPWIDQTLVMISRHEHLFADLTDVVRRPWQLYNVLLLAFQQDVMGKLLFGSDFPFCTPAQAISTIYSINTLPHGTNLPTVPREQLRQIIERDVLDALGIKWSPGTSSDEPSPDDDDTDTAARESEYEQDAVGAMVLPEVAGDADNAEVASEASDSEERTAASTDPTEPEDDAAGEAVEPIDGKAKGEQG